MVIACRSVSDLKAAVADLSRVSPPLAEALQSRPELLDGLEKEATVSSRVLAALIPVALSDVRGEADLETTTRALSDAMDGIVATELERAIDDVSDRHPVAPGIGFSVIAMGKWGAREINYYSDIDLVFVHEAGDAPETQARAAALAIAGRLMAALRANTFDGPLLNVDADLRPEGSIGPLSRSIEGFSGYYQRWGEAWELQALLKSRFSAGDVALGKRFRELADRIIWEEGLDVDALRSIRALKARAEEEAPAGDIKRSRGGIRDIEFSVQILQLVHGRADEDLRVTATLDAIPALSSHGYIEESEAERLRDAYRFLRNLEHRIQLRELRQTHTLPAAPEERELLGRAMGYNVDPVTELETHLAEVRSTVRDLHERLYFRPILDALVGLDTSRLTQTGAAVRLEALGFRKTVAASKAVNDLLSGMSRRSSVMRQMLPLMLDWLSQSPDPDLGLAQLRLLLARSTDHAPLIRVLQTNPVAGERLCTLLGTGKLVGDLMDRIPEFVPRLADDDLLATIRPLNDETTRLLGVLESRPDREMQIGTIRRFVRRRKLRIAARDILGMAPTGATINVLSDTADSAVIGAWTIVAEETDRFGVIAMGRWGGRELSYGSDIDLMYVHGADNTERGLELTVEMGRVLSEPNRHGEAYTIDAGLRPEGRKGPMSRSLDSFRRYYQEWVAPWELLALVKARPAAGDSELLADYFEMVGPVIWRESLTREVVTEIRAIKARVESERIPAGEDPDFHLKLGPGGLSDIEFATQLLQLRHGGAIPELRVTGTFPALIALRDTGLLTAPQFHALNEAYLFCTQVRLRLHLQSGRLTDSLPVAADATSRLAVSLGFERSGELREEYMRVTRRSRRIFEQVFYD